MFKGRLSADSIADWIWIFVPSGPMVGRGWSAAVVIWPGLVCPVLMFMAAMLPVANFHVVFTVPEAINRLALYRPATVYGLPFSTAWGVLQHFAPYPKHLGAHSGMIAFLHTWGSSPVAASAHALSRARWRVYGGRTLKNGT